MERLQHALDEGRIDLGEFDERTKSALEAKTNAELDLIFEDLPQDRAADQAVNTIELTPEERAEREAAVQGRVHGRRGLPASVQTLIWVAVPTTAIWLISSVSSGEVQNFWPAWPIGIMLAIFLAQWLTSGRNRDR